MSNLQIFPTIVSRALWLPELKPDDWVRLQVYPDAISHSKAQGDYRKKSRALFVQSGRANLRHLCALAGLEFDAKRDSVEKLADRLLASESSKELIYLATFLRRRKTSVVEYFAEVVDSHQQSTLVGEILAHSDRRKESPKPFTKLVHIYLSSPGHLESIHFQHAWRRLPTAFAYESPSGITKAQVKTLIAEFEGLVTQLDKLKPGETYEIFGQKLMCNDLRVFVIHRRFPPSVRADYLNNFRLQHDFSTVVFSVNEDAGKISVKVANRALAEAIRHWIEDTLSLELTTAGSSLFSDYKPESVEEAFLGGYDESQGIDLIRISFGQSYGPSRSPMTLETAGYARSVRDDLAWLKKSKVIRLRSLSDIASFQVNFEQHKIEVVAISEDGGAIRFRVNDTGLSEEMLSSFHSSFYEAFLIPLDQSIDPTLLAMGPADIYHFLLGGGAESEVQPYQKESLGKLLERGLLETVEGTVGKCTEFHCASRGQPVADDALTECPNCQGELTREAFRRYEENTKARVRTVRDLLHKATGWKVAQNTVSLESHQFYRLSSSKHPDKTVCVFINDRLDSGKMETFHRAMFPVIVVHPLGPQRVPVVDAAGIAHLGLPHMLAASENAGVDWKKFKEASQAVLQQLLSLERERVLRASRLSHEKLLEHPTGYDDRSYEADVFNSLRSLFPYTVKWGGGNKPDGFASLVYFPQNDLSKPVNFNWSYDAKFSETSYAFGIGEFRQMFDYVRRLHAAKRLQSLGNRYDAHVIITNSMDKSCMKNAADFMATQHRLGQDIPAFKLVFMRDSFLTRLWERVRAEESEFDKRTTYVPEYFVQAIIGNSSNGYSLLDGVVADGLADQILNQDPLQRPVDAEKLKGELSDQIVRSGRNASSKTAS